MDLFGTDPGEAWRAGIVADSEAMDTFREVAREKTLGAKTEEQDFALVEAFCEHYAIWRLACLKVREEGIMVMTPRGFLQKNPSLSVADSEADLVKKLAAELGMSARGRKMLGVTGGDDTTNPEALLS